MKWLKYFESSDIPKGDLFTLIDINTHIGILKSKIVPIDNSDVSKLKSILGGDRYMMYGTKDNDIIRVYFIIKNFDDREKYIKNLHIDQVKDSWEVSKYLHNGFEIQKMEDDWFLVYSDYGERIYKCDTIDGITQLLKSIKVI